MTCTCLAALEDELQKALKEHDSPETPYSTLVWVWQAVQSARCKQEANAQPEAVPPGSSS